MKYQPEWVKQAQQTGKKPFFVQMPIKHYHKQNITTILGIGTAAERSRTGHKMSQNFINKLKETSIGKHLLVNHDPNKIAGKVTGIKEGQPDEILPIADLLQEHPNPVVDAPRATVEHWIQNGVQLGLSFGGTATDTTISKEKNGQLTYEINDGELMEWSVTPINAVKRSDGSVQPVTEAEDGCPGGICQQIVTQIIDGPMLPEIQEDTINIEQSADYTFNENVIENALESEIEEENTVIDELDKNMEDNNMSEEVKELKQMIENQNKLIQSLIDDKKAREKLEQEAKEKEKIENQIKEAVEEERTVILESTKDFINEQFGNLVKDREGVTQTSETTEEDGEVVEALKGKDEGVVKQGVKFNDPIHYPAVVNGKITQGYIPGSKVTG